MEMQDLGVELNDGNLVVGGHKGVRVLIDLSFSDFGGEEGERNNE